MSGDKKDDNVHYADFGKDKSSNKGGRGKKKDDKEVWRDKLTAAADAAMNAKGDDRTRAKEAFRQMVGEMPENVAREISGHGTDWKNLIESGVKLGLSVLNLLARRR